MRQFITTLLLLLMMTPCLMAQKTKANNARQELSQARSSIKSGNYADAEKRVSTLLKDSTNRTNKKIWLAYYDAVLGQYEQGNEKLYLKQQYSFSNHMYILKNFSFAYLCSSFLVIDC